jgi:hypothetical protein
VLVISYCASKKSGVAHLASPDTAHDLSLGGLIA